MRRNLTALLAVLGLAFLPVSQALAQAIETPAEQALLIDDATGAILLEKNADELMHPASMSKLMTLFLVFERLRAGTLSLDDTFRVSEKAWRMGGSKMFVEVNSRVSIEDLLMGVIVQSGNDASIVLAEGIAGTEEAFAEEMTRRAHEIGMTHTTFRNSTGWPDPEHLTTAHDLAKLAQATIHNFPKYYDLFDETTFTYNDIKQGNRNPLLYKDIGADGLKTGHTEESGYGLVASAVRGERRLILVLNGLDSVGQRSQEAERLIDWGFREFGNYELLAAGETVEEAPVWLGDETSVPLTIEEDLLITMSRKARREMAVTIEYDSPIPAPVQKGTKLAQVRIEAPGMETVSRDLVAAQDVGRLGFFGRLGAAVSHIVWGSQSALN